MHAKAEGGATDYRTMDRWRILTLGCYLHFIPLLPSVEMVWARKSRRKAVLQDRGASKQGEMMTERGK